MPSSTLYAVLLALVLGVGCGGSKEKPEPPQATPKKLIANPVVEKAIRKELKKPTGELTKADLEKVTRLDLGGNKLTELQKELENLTQLTWLELSSNQLTEVPKGLEKLTQLMELYLRNNQLTDVKGLEKLTQLKSLVLQNNPALTKAQIAELQKALPKCQISSNPTK